MIPISKGLLVSTFEDNMSDLIDAIGWDIYILNEESTGNPFDGSLSTETKKYPIKALVEKNKDAYKNLDYTVNKEMKICKIMVSDIQAISSNIPTPPDSLKKANIKIGIDNGTPFSITNESFEGFLRQMVVLEIERDY